MYASWVELGIPPHPFLNLSTDPEDWISKQVGQRLLKLVFETGLYISIFISLIAVKHLSLN